MHNVIKSKECIGVGDAEKYSLYFDEHWTQTVLQNILGGWRLSYKKYERGAGSNIEESCTFEQQFEYSICCFCDFGANSETFYFWR